MLCRLLLAAAASPALAGPPAPAPLECGMRKLAFERAKEMQPWSSAAAVFDSLELGSLCGMPAPPPAPAERPAADAAQDPAGAIHVVARRDPRLRTGDGSAEAPFASVERALASWRALRASSSAPPPIVLHAGVHFLNATMELTSADSGLVIQSAADAAGKAWLSGGKALGTLDWKPAAGFGGGRVLVASLAGRGLSAVPGLFTLESHERLTRARFPNADVETAQWGYDSPLRDDFSIEAAKVDHWHKPPSGELPTYTYHDFTVPGNVAGAVKNDSGMYTEWTSGLGGICDLWSPDENSDGSPAGSYWCGNASSGGWAEVDKQCATSGQLQLPVGMTYDKADPQLKRFSEWSNATGAIIHAWHSQSWALHMFNVSSHDPESGSMDFAAGGWQGGRNWCSCAQCSYAAPWCDTENGDDRLISGSWCESSNSLPQPSRHAVV